MTTMYLGQAEADHANLPQTWGDVKSLENQTIEQDAGRSGDLVDFTLMKQDASTKKWYPFTDETTELPIGIYRGGTILEATIAAGDVEGNDILVGGDCNFREEDLVIENSLTLDTVLTVAGMTVRAYLHSIGFYPNPTKAADAQL